MRRVAIPLGLLVLLLGCGVEIDLDKDPDKLRSDIRRRGAEELRPFVEALDARLDEEQRALEALDARLAGLPPEELLGEEADDFAQRIRTSEDRLARLRAQRAVYVDRLDAVAREEAEDAAQAEDAEGTARPDAEDT